MHHTFFYILALQTTQYAKTAMNFYLFKQNSSVLSRKEEFNKINKINVSELTNTLAKRLSNSMCSGIGCEALLRTLACRTWWFCCWCFQWPMPLDGDGVIIEITSSGDKFDGDTSRDVNNPILVVVVVLRSSICYVTPFLTFLQ